MTHPHHFRTVFLGAGRWGEVESGQFIDAVGRECFDALVKTFQQAWPAMYGPGLLEAQAWWMSLFGTAQVFMASPPDARLSDRHALLELQLKALWKGLTNTVAEPARQRRSKA